MSDFVPGRRMQREARRAALAALCPPHPDAAPFAFTAVRRFAWADQRPAVRCPRCGQFVALATVAALAADPDRRERVRRGDEAMHPAFGWPADLRWHGAEGLLTMPRLVDACWRWWDAQPAVTRAERRAALWLREERIMDRVRLANGARARVWLLGEDGNAFNVIGRVRTALREAGATPDEVRQFVEEATARDYDHVLATAMRWAEVS